MSYGNTQYLLNISQTNSSFASNPFFPLGLTYKAINKCSLLPLCYIPAVFVVWLPQNRGQVSNQEDNLQNTQSKSLEIHAHPLDTGFQREEN